MIFTCVSVSIAQLMVFIAFINVFFFLTFFFNVQTSMCFGSCYGRLIVYAANYSGTTSSNFGTK